jgi:hypothetical protein
METERGRFDFTILDNSCLRQLFTSKSFNIGRLAPSSYQQLLTVIHSRGVSEQGQKRDKFPGRSVVIARHSWPCSFTFFPIISTVCGIAGRRKLRGCIYARFSTKFQHSIEDQIRVCREWAAKNDIEIADIHIFEDRVKTGKTHNRAGLRAMLAALAGDEVDVVITFATNRIFRKMYRSLQFVEEEIVDRKKRCVFVSQHIDTAQIDSWRNVMQVYAMLDEVQVQTLGNQVRAAHEGLLLNNYVHSTITFGYCGKAVEGAATRTGKQRRVWEIDQSLSKWVMQIFQWFVNDPAMGYAQIARRLRKEQAPPPPRVGRWTWRAVKLLLANRRYLGDFSYGLSETIWQNRAGYSRQFQREQPRMVHQNESLRIIDDALFEAAQERIAVYKGQGGRRRKGSNEQDVVRPLKDLLWCPTHSRYLTVCGNRGQLMACPDCKRQDVPALYSFINSDLAQRLIINELCQRIQTDDNLVGQVVASAFQQVQILGRPDTAKQDELKREKGQLTESIAFILDCPGDTHTDKAENHQRIAYLRSQRSAIDREIAQLREATNAPVNPPTEDQVRQILENLSAILSESFNDSATVADIRSILIALTGGKIVMTQQGEPRSKRGWLRGTFRIRLVDTLLHRSGFASGSAEQVEVTIDFRAPCASEELADPVKALFDQGILIKAIARQLKVSRNLVTAALKFWFTYRGLPIPDGRSAVRQGLAMAA